MNKHKVHFLMVPEISQDRMDVEGKTERREGFSMSEKIPKGKHQNFYTTAKSWNLKRSTRGGCGGSFERRRSLHTAALGAATGMQG